MAAALVGAEGEVAVVVGTLGLTDAELLGGIVAAAVAGTDGATVDALDAGVAAVGVFAGVDTDELAYVTPGCPDVGTTIRLFGPPVVVVGAWARDDIVDANEEDVGSIEVEAMLSPVFSALDGGVVCALPAASPSLSSKEPTAPDLWGVDVADAVGAFWPAPDFGVAVEVADTPAAAGAFGLAAAADVVGAF